MSRKETTIDVIDLSKSPSPSSNKSGHTDRTEVVLDLCSDTNNDDCHKKIESDSNKIQSSKKEERIIRKWKRQRQTTFITQQRTLRNGGTAYVESFVENTKKKQHQTKISKRYNDFHSNAFSDAAAAAAADVASIRSVANFSPVASISSNHLQEDKSFEQAIANSNRDVRDMQDAEYYESLHQDQEKERKKHRLELKKEADDQMKQAIRDSIVTEEIRKRMEALERLLPEPKIGEDFVTIAFKLPPSTDNNKESNNNHNSKRIERNFERDCTADQLYLFIESLEELFTLKKWKLCQVVPPKTIHRSRTIKELGLIPRGVVILQEIIDEH